MSKHDLRVQIKLAWWFRPYVIGLALMSAITGCEPDWNRVQRWIDRALRVKVD